MNAGIHILLSPEDRTKLIDRLDRSFQKMPEWAQTACKHAMAAPSINPATGEPFKSFRETIAAAEDDTLLILKDDFETNGDLLPE